MVCLSVILYPLSNLAVAFPGKAPFGSHLSRTCTWEVNIFYCHTRTVNLWNNHSKQKMSKVAAEPPGQLFDGLLDVAPFVNVSLMSGRLHQV